MNHHIAETHPIPPVQNRPNGGAYEEGGLREEVSQGAPVYPTQYHPPLRVLAWLERALSPQLHQLPRYRGEGGGDVDRDQDQDQDQERE